MFRKTREKTRVPLDLRALENLAEVKDQPSLIHSAFESGDKIGTASGAQREHAA